jgi:hypothetical protein
MKFPRDALEGLNRKVIRFEMKIFFYASLGTFVLGLFLACFIDRALAPRAWFENPGADAFIANLSSKYGAVIDGDVRVPLDSKQKKEFFLVSRVDEEGGVGVKLCSNPELFNRIFPGYFDLACKSHAFWDYYFDSPMNTSVHFDALSDIHISSIGCIKFFQYFGGDGIIFGTSESAKGILAGNLAAATGVEKLLQCARGGSTIENTRLSAKAIGHEIQAGQKKPQIAIWALSYWSAAFPYWASRDADERPQLEELRRFERMSKNPENFRWERSLADSFPTISWKDLAPVTSEQFMKPVWERGSTRGCRETDAMTQGEGAEGFYFRSARWPRDPDVERYGRASKPHFGMLEVPGESCDLATNGVGQKIYQTIRQLSAISKSVYIFLTPLTPSVTDYGPPCLRPAVVKLLKDYSREHKEVVVNTDAWKEFGLTWADYMNPTIEKNCYSVNANHLNYFGAQKVTEKVGRWMTDSRTQVSR